jgi:hypothetical protein
MKRLICGGLAALALGLGWVAGSAADGTESGDAAAGIGSGFGIMWLLWGGMWTLIWAAFAINHTLKERRR